MLVLYQFIICCLIQSYDIGTGVDNIEVDPHTGDLWIGCHPLRWAIMDLNVWFGFALPSQVVFSISTTHSNCLFVGVDDLLQFYLLILQTFQYSFKNRTWIVRNNEI